MLLYVYRREGGVCNSWVCGLFLVMGGGELEMKN